MAELQKPVEEVASRTAMEAATEAKLVEEVPTTEPQGNNKHVEEAPPAQLMKEGVPEEARQKNLNKKKEGVLEEARRKSLNEKKEVAKRKSSKEAMAKRKSTRKSMKGDELDADEEEVEEVPKIIYPIEEKIQQTLRMAWTLLVKKNQKKKTEISETDVPIVMRSIGINPTELQIQTLIAYAKTQDLANCSKGFLTYENFEQRVAETLQLQSELWIRKSKEEILAALHTVCEYKDKIEADKFKKLLMTKGDVMTDPEGSMMLRVARDRDTHMVYLDEYVHILSKDAIPQPPSDPTVW